MNVASPSGDGSGPKKSGSSSKLGRGIGSGIRHERSAEIHDALADLYAAEDRTDEVDKWVRRVTPRRSNAP